MFLEEEITTKVPLNDIWEVWNRIYSLSSASGFVKGGRGKVCSTNKKKASYEIIEVKDHEYFKVRWKGFFTNLLFTYFVKRRLPGSMIKVKVEFRGLLGWMSFFFARKNVRKNISDILKQFTQNLEKRM